MKTNFWQFLYRVGWFAILALLGIGFVCVFVPRYRHLRSLGRRKMDLEAQNAVLQRTTAELQLKQERFLTDPTFVERVAHETGRIKPGEILFRFTNQTVRAEIR